MKELLQQQSIVPPLKCMMLSRKNSSQPTLQKDAGSFGLALRRGEDRDFPSVEILQASKCFIQYVYETTNAPTWAPKGSYIIVGNKEMLRDESRNPSFLSKCHMDELADDIEKRIRGIIILYCVLLCFHSQINFFSKGLPAGRITVKHYTTGQPEKHAVHFVRGEPITLTDTDFAFIMTLGATDENA